MSLHDRSHACMAVEKLFLLFSRFMYIFTTQRIGQLKGRVSLDTVRAVEFVEDSAFNLAHTFQVNKFSSS